MQRLFFLRMTAKKEQLNLRIDRIQILAMGWIHLVLVDPAGGNMPLCEPGQFVEVAVDRAPVLLNRPFSVYNSTDKALELLVAPIGRASTVLGEYAEGDTLRVIMPLGHGFSAAPAGSRVLLVGGGVGIAPLFYQMLRLKAAGAVPTVIFGARTAPDRWLCERFEAECTFHICTDDGSYGFHGLVTQHPAFAPANYDLIQICGPKPMMKACATAANGAGVDTELSLENHMACGLGACLCCVEDTIDGNVCVCKNGPVFNLNALKW